MRVLPKQNAKCAWLYADGHCVVMFKKRDRELNIDIDHVEIWERMAVQCRFTGRIVLHDPAMIHLAFIAHRIEAREPSLSHGSENSKKAGYAIGSMSIYLAKDCDYGIHLHDIPRLIGSGYSYQPEMDDAQRNQEGESVIERLKKNGCGWIRWSDYPVTRFHPFEDKTAKQVAVG